MDKTVLIMTDSFPPDMNPRMGYLCKYIKEFGWNPIIITIKRVDHKRNFKIPNLDSVDKHFYSPLKTTNKIEWLTKKILDFITEYQERSFFKISKSSIAGKHIDAVLCCTWTNFPLKSANQIAHTYKIPLVCDLRDILEQYNISGFGMYTPKHCKKTWNLLTNIYKNNLITHRNNILRQADAVISVSPWHVEQLSKANSNTKLIYNGYDDDIFKPKTEKTEKFVITYTGRILSLEVRNPKLMIEAVKELIAEGKINDKDINITWYTDKKSVETIKGLLDDEELNGLMTYHDMVSSDKIPEILNTSSICIILTNKTNGANSPKGVMTTKFFEALGCKRPVLCVKSDEGCLADIIKKTNAGKACRDTEETKDFILKKYQEWKEKGYTTQDVNEEERQKLSRREEAKEFAEILDSVIDKQKNNSRKTRQQDNMSPVKVHNGTEN